MCLPLKNNSHVVMPWYFPGRYIVIFHVNLIDEATVLNFIKRSKHFSQATNCIQYYPNLAQVIFWAIYLFSLFFLIFDTFLLWQQIEFGTQTEQKVYTTLSCYQTRYIQKESSFDHLGCTAISKSYEKLSCQPFLVGHKYPLIF